MSDPPLIQSNLPRSSLVRAEDALSCEWLVTNGLGGFACGTVSQANTRRYHGLLVAALRPPVERVVMVSKVDATVQYRGREYQLGCNEFSDGTLSPRGFELLTAFQVEDGAPVWTYSFADVVLEQRIWMAYGRNTTYVSFRLCAASEPADIDLTPLCTYRDYHAHTSGGWAFREVVSLPRGCQVTAFGGARPYRLTLDHGEFAPGADWYWHFRHRAEAERGLDVTEDLLKPGVLRSRLKPDDIVTLTCTAEPDEPETPVVAREKEFIRRRALLRGAPDDAPGWIRQLTLAADQFVVSRRARPRSDATAPGDRKVPAAAPGTTIIAGYPWFSDWGRDTMISLPGLTISTGRMADAAVILRTFAAHTSQGMLPNRFPDGGEPPEYNTVDAALWYFHAIDAYLQATQDQALLAEIYPVLKEIIAWHRRGTRYSIQVDPADGLLRAGEPGVQLTWMDAKIGDWVVTPRHGKPVEINALWHYALVCMSKWATSLNDKHAAKDYAAGADRAVAAFSSSFWFEQGGYLYDVVDCLGAGGDSNAAGDPTVAGHPRAPGSTEARDIAADGTGRRVDPTLRPNQIFAVSLGTNLLNPARSRAVVDTCARELLTPLGMRSLSPRDPRYSGIYSGGPAQRDAMYHQGPVWSWLLGPFVLAHFHVYKNAGYARVLLEGMAAHLSEGCLGAISEIMDGDAPHAPRGCFAQAWGVSETLRAWHSLRL
jgi:predicted glycogen debranching enzyme